MKFVSLKYSLLWYHFRIKIPALNPIMFHYKCGTARAVLLATFPFSNSFEFTK